jgi:hypothetical protein
VLPVREAASSPTEQKSTAIWPKPTANSNFYKIPLLFRYFWSFRIVYHLKEVPNLLLSSTVLACFSLKILQNKFLLFFQYFWLKYIAVPLSRCRRY